MSQYDDDFDWVPPSVAEMKVIEAKRERQDKISRIMGQYLLKGYQMLATSCPKCNTIELKTRGGEIYCIACQEVDCHETSKDDPALNDAAARGLLREQSAGSVGAVVPTQTTLQPRSDRSSIPSTSLSERTTGESLERPSANPTPEAIAESSVSARDFPTGGELEIAPEAEKAVQVIMRKLSTVRERLSASRDDQLQQNTEMLRCIKEAAEAISALKKLQQ